MNDQPFIIRVYGIYIHPDKGLLVSDEIVKGKEITKFPGGGLEYGEGPVDCLLREMREETGHKFKVQSHFYTTDYFVPSAFHENKQVISIYYVMEPVDDVSIRIAENKFDFEKKVEGAQSFRFIALSDITTDEFSLSIDRQVGDLLRNFYNTGGHEKSHQSGGGL